MVATLRSDPSDTMSHVGATPRTDSDFLALEHILDILLGEPLIPAANNVDTPFRACLSEAGVDVASDFISMNVVDYAGISFSLSKGGDKSSVLNAIQTKKLSALF